MKISIKSNPISGDIPQYPSLRKGRTSGMIYLMLSNNQCVSLGFENGDDFEPQLTEYSDFALENGQYLLFNGEITLKN